MLRLFNAHSLVQGHIYDARSEENITKLGRVKYNISLTFTQNLQNHYM